MERSGEDGEWADVRATFNLSPDLIDMSALLIASHPRPVREAIERYRRELNASPTVYLQSNNEPLTKRTLAAAAAYLGARARDIALTDSTTMGLGLIYNGFQLRPGEEFLRTEQNYYSTDEALRLAGGRTGARVRTVSLFDDIRAVSADRMVDSVVSAISPVTRVLALTWVHSSTGLKLPVRRIAEGLREVNRKRGAAERVLMCVDGVHGFGVEDAEVSELGCDFFIAGCQKWLFGPRGTGIVWGNEAAWSAVTPTIPSFLDDSVHHAWIEGKVPPGPTTAARMTPGGFKAYEHRWALAEAFDFQRKVGKTACPGAYPWAQPPAQRRAGEDAARYPLHASFR